MASLFSTIFSCWMSPAAPPPPSKEEPSVVKQPLVAPAPQPAKSTAQPKENSTASYPTVPKANPPVYTPPVDWGGWDGESDEEPVEEEIVIDIPSKPIQATIVNSFLPDLTPKKDLPIEEEEDYFANMEPTLKPTEVVLVQQRGNAATAPSNYKSKLSRLGLDDDDEDDIGSGWGESMGSAEKAALRNATRAEKQKTKQKRQGLGATKSGVQFDTSDD